ncbi:hypothetical protein PHISP_04336 [Aspergillus sp. HF37]|nr:hypothetical protein PHISP_04336 [Aspergillus sp. HF37]
MGTDLPFDAESRQGGIVLSHTFRVDARSKHLLAAPLTIQNVEAWKSSHRDRKRVANGTRAEVGNRRYRATGRMARAAGVSSGEAESHQQGRESRKANKQKITDT